MRGLLVLILLPGCIENVLEKRDTQPAFTDPTGTDTHPPDTDTTTVPVDDTAPPVDTCPDAVPPDDTVAQDVSCAGEPTPFTGILQERWRVGLTGYATEIGAARVVDGNGDGVIDAADPMSLLVDSAWGEMTLYDADGGVLDREHSGAWRVWGTLAEVDAAHLGAEAVSAGYDLSGLAYVSVDAESGVVRNLPVAGYFSNYPWVTDLEGDGLLEVLQGPQVIDVASGVSRTLAGTWRDDITIPVTADLDRDGVEEILLSNWASPEVVLRDPDGNELGTCLSDGGHSFNAAWAIGNLDGDDDGEFVAAGDGYVALCDTDGSLLARTDVGMMEPGLVGLAQLDDDPAPEIVVEDQFALVALDDDLSERWRWTSGGLWHPFALADLDQEGHHEIVVHADGNLVVLSSAGAELARLAVDDPGSGAWRSQPVVVDLDGDGLAEIVVGGYSLVVVESPEGGWAVPGAEYPWPAGDHHPGDRTLAGEVVPAEPFWIDPAQNVWQGLPTGTVDWPELAVQIEDVCVEACDGDAVVTVAVSNPGVQPVWGDVPVQLESVDRGEVLASTTVGSPAAGVRRHVVFRVPATAVAEGLRARVDAEDQVRECDQRDNEDVYRDTPCP